jgi:mono/diheme cytochrome c family protein
LRVWRRRTAGHLAARRVHIGAFIGALSLFFPSVRGATPGERAVKAANPFAGSAAAAEEGRKLYSANGCSACHGVEGGGGMGKALLDDTWAFGSDDETLFKLMKGQIPQQTMPKTWASLPDDQMWKMIAYVRTLYKGDPALIDWAVTKPAAKKAQP